MYSRGGTVNTTAVKVLAIFANPFWEEQQKIEKELGRQLNVCVCVCVFLS